MGPMPCKSIISVMSESALLVRAISWPSPPMVNVTSDIGTCPFVFVFPLLSWGCCGCSAKGRRKLSACSTIFPSVFVSQSAFRGLPPLLLLVRRFFCRWYDPSLPFPALLSSASSLKVIRDTVSSALACGIISFMPAGPTMDASSSTGSVF